MRPSPDAATMNLTVPARPRSDADPETRSSLLPAESPVATDTTYGLTGEHPTCQRSAHANDGSAVPILSLNPLCSISDVTPVLHFAESVPTDYPTRPSTSNSPTSDYPKPRPRSDGHTVSPPNSCHTDTLPPPPLTVRPALHPNSPFHTPASLPLFSSNRLKPPPPHSIPPLPEGETTVDRAYMPTNSTTELDTESMSSKGPPCKSTLTTHLTPHH